MLDALAGQSYIVEAGSVGRRQTSSSIMVGLKSGHLKELLAKQETNVKHCQQHMSFKQRYWYWSKLFGLVDETVLNNIQQLRLKTAGFRSCSKSYVLATFVLIISHIISVVS